MNSLGRQFRVSILGESHGECAGILIDGCPAGIPLSREEFSFDLNRRRGGRKGTTSRKEPDIPLLKTGLFENRTTGAPILILFENTNVDSSVYENIRFTPRPGQADFVAFHKYSGFNDYRGGGAFSGRLTAGLVAAGVIAKKIISPVSVEAQIIAAGGSNNIEAAVNKAVEKGESIGGIVECTVRGLPIGLGEPFFDSVESLISHMVFSIPAVVGIEFGAGFSAARMTGKENNDEICNLQGITKTNNAGGINGGITNGNEVVFKVAVKPTSSISASQRTINVKTGARADIAVRGRHDACIALRIPVIIEAVTAIIFADFMIVAQKIRRIAG